MKKLVSVILGSIFILVGSSCAAGGDSSPSASENAVIPDGYTRVDIDDEAKRYKFEGIGAQMDQCLFSGSYVGLDGIDANITDQDVAVWEERLEYKKIYVTRMCIITDWYELENDNDDPEVLNEDGFNWNTVKMQCVYKVLDLCKKHDIRMNLSWYGIYPASWNALNRDGEAPGWLDLPADDAEFAESVYAALKHLTEMGYGSVINEISFYPEPSTEYVRSGGFRRMIEAVDAKLTKEGIREAYCLSGPAEVSDYEIFEEVFESVGDLFDRYTGSFYKLRNSNDNATMKMGMKPFAELADTAGKAYGVSEFGSNETTNPPSAAAQMDTDTYRRAMYVARFAINALDSGFTYMSYWVLGNSYYDGTMMDLGLWKYKNKNWELRPQYYTYSLITRYTDRNSSIYGTDLNEFGNVCMVALQNEGGKWTYLLANSGATQEKLSVVNANFSSGSMDKYEVTENSIPMDGQTLGIDKSNTVSVENGALNLIIRPNSVMVLTNIAAE